MLAVLVASGIRASAASVEVASYDLRVTLDPATHRLEGSERVRWTNTTSAVTDELWLHLYLNAFASPRTTFMRELDTSPIHGRAAATDGWGWIRIRSLVLDDGSDLLARLEFQRPDDGNPDDFTLARVPLPRQVRPGDAVELVIDFEVQLPTVVSRTGYVGDFHLVAQWFPKLAVFAGEAGWNRHQFHADSEFFADFGDYRLAITLPADWVVAASGIEIDRAPAADGRQTVTYRAERVHDVAWCAAPPDLMEVVDADFEPGRDVPPAWLEKARARVGRSAAELELPPMQIRLLVPRGQRPLAPRMLRATRLAVAWMGLHYGVFPYPQLTVVSPPPEARDAGGMEYPTFITTGADRYAGLPPLSWKPDLESVTVHEFAHQYFQSLLASNEFEEAWLDEGLASYTEVACLADMAADDLLPGPARFSYWGAERVSLALSRQRVTPAIAAWEFVDGDSYFVGSYTRPALALRTVENLIGSRAMARGLRAYVERHRFSHPTGRDLVAALSAEAGRDLEPLMEQMIWDDAVPDWEVRAVRQRRRSEVAGLSWNGTSWEADRGDTATASSGDPWLVEVDLLRTGDLQAPVEVELAWEDGTVELREWEGGEPRVRWQLTSDRQLQQVVIDPAGVWALETNRRNNYWRRGPASGGRVLWWLREGFDLAAILLLRVY